MMKLIAVAAIVGAGLVCAPAAHADTNAFLAAARAAGYAQPDDELLRNGYLICASSAQDGVSDDLIGRGIAAAQRWLGQDVNEGRDQQFIDLAQRYLCPTETQ
jgi:hypothetical protein